LERVIASRHESAARYSARESGMNAASNRSPR
jgi:hypothetical protein